MDKYLLLFRFDMIIVCEMLLVMQYTPVILPQGQGILQMFVEEYSITFSDTYKFFGQKLETLPTRFQLDVFKGFFSHVSNIPENWGILRREPFELKTYINKRDSESVKKEKALWREMFKNKNPIFDINSQCVQYCQQDVLVLLKSALKFAVQTFEFGEEMILRFGKSLAYKDGLCMPLFYPWNKSFPTLGAYR